MNPCRSQGYEGAAFLPSLTTAPRRLEPRRQASACTDRDATDLFWVYQINGHSPMPLSLGTLGSTERSPVCAENDGYDATLKGSFPEVRGLRVLRPAVA
jgi:hypothetical protein